jgi:transposase
VTIIRIGLDTSKHIFQVHGVDEQQRPVLRRQLRRSELEKFFAELPSTRIGLEACGALHHWARVLRGVGHEAVLMLLKVRDLLTKQRTMVVNAIRGHAAEFAVVGAKGPVQLASCGWPGSRPS